MGKAEAKWGSQVGIEGCVQDVEQKNAESHGDGGHQKRLGQKLPDQLFSVRPDDLSDADLFHPVQVS